MKKFILSTILLLASPLFGQVTTGYHRVSQVVARGSSGTQAVVVPNANIYVTSTATGTVATIYSDPGLSIPIITGMVTSDLSGNYSYYVPLNYCVNERVSYPGSGNFTTTNICLNGGAGQSIAPSQITNGTNGQVLETVSNTTVWHTLSYTEITNLWAEGACVGYLKSDGTCSIPVSLSVQTNGTPNTSQVVLNHVDTPSVSWANPSGGVEEANVNFLNSLTMAVTPPVGGQYVIIYPTGSSASGSGSAGTTGGSFFYAKNCAFSTTGTAAWTFAGALAAQAPWVVAANVTSVYAFAFSNDYTINIGEGGCLHPLQDHNGSVGINATGTGSTSPNIFPSVPDNKWSMQQTTGQMVGLTGANIDTVSINGTQNTSGDWIAGETSTIPLVGLIVYYTGTAPPTPTSVNVAPPLYYASDTNTLGISPDATFYASKLFSSPQVKNLPDATANTGVFIPVQDGLTSSDCATGGGSNYVLCRSDGTIWTLAGGSSSTVNVNGSPVSNPNFNGSTPAAGANGKNITMQVSGSNVSGEIVGDGDATHYFDGTGNFSVPAGSGSGISGQTAGYAIEANSATTATGPFPMDDAVTTAATITAHKALAVDDGSGVGGTVYLKQGTAAPNGTTAVALTVPTSVTSYRIQLPGTHPTGSNNFLSCTSADPAVCTWAAAGSSGLTSINSQTGPAITVHSSDSSITVTTTTNDIDLTTAGGASGVQYNPTNTLYLWAGPDSIIGDDGTNWYYGTPIPLTSWSRTGSVCTFTSTSAHGLLMNDWVSADQVSGFAPPSPFAPWTTGYDLFQVASVPDSTHWTVNCPLISSTGASGGTAESANYFLPFYTASLPFFVGHGATQTALPVNSTITSMVANYSTVLHPRIIANSPNPTYVLITGGRNDIQNCTSVATLESDLQSVWASIHTDGGKVVQATLTPSPYNTTNIGCHTAFAAMAQLNEWIKGQSKTSANVASGQYWDRLVDANAAFYDLNDPNQITATGSMNAAVIANYANLVNEGMSTQGNALRGYPNYIQAGVNGGSLSPGFGISYVPSADSTFAFSWWNHAQTTLLMDVDTLSNRVGFSYLGAAGCLGTSSGGWLTGGACVGTTPNALTMNNSNTGAASGSTFDGSAAKTISTNSIGAPNLTASNTFSGATTQDFSGVSQLKLPVAGGYASAANGELGFDSTGKNWHAWGNAVDNLVPLAPVASPPSDGQCAQWSVTAGVYTLNHTSGACGTSSGTVTTTGSPASGDIAAFSGASSITTATATQVNTLIKTLTGCNTATNVYVPQSGTCVAPSGGSGAWTNITGSSQITASGCTQSASTAGYCSISGSSTTTLTLSVIPAHNRMQLIVWGQTSSAGYVTYNFNSDSTSGNYFLNGVDQIGAVAPSANQAGSLAACYAGQIDTAGVSQIISDINFYADTTFSKAATSRNSVTIAASNSANEDQSLTCGWTGTAAITSVTANATAGHFVAGTKFMILVQD